MLPNSFDPRPCLQHGAPGSNFGHVDMSHLPLRHGTMTVHGSMGAGCGPERSDHVYCQHGANSRVDCQLF